MRLAKESSGRVIDWAGDGCFLSFETARAAVVIGLRQVHVDETDLPGVRIGVHMGEVTEKPGPDDEPRFQAMVDNMNFSE